MKRAAFRFVSIVTFFLLAVALILPRTVEALPAGFQEFYLPLPTGNNPSSQPYNGTYSVFNAIEPPINASDGMHYVVGVTASANNTKVYYDHWENGLGTGTGSDEVVSLNKGQIHTFESGSIPVPRGTTTKYDGGDRIFVSGSLLQLVVSTWTEDQGSLFTDAWEVYPVQAWENSYTVPAGENLAVSPLLYRNFTYVFALVMSASDGNSVTISDPAGPVTINTTLNRGQTYIYEVEGAGTKITGSAGLQVQLMTGRRDSTGYEMRGYTITPQAYWGSGYYAPVPGWSSSNNNLYIYNPNASQITVNFEDLSGSGSFTVAAGATRSYRSGAGRYVPLNSGVYLYTSGDIFWGIAAGDDGNGIWDWGYDLIPTHFIGTDNYVSWAPGNRTKASSTVNGSPVYITALNDNTTVFIDFGPNDEVFDATYNVDRLHAIQVYDPDKDNTGMHIVSTAPVAVAWGESPDRAGQADPYLDMGYTTLPLPVEWIDVTLQVEKTADPVQIYLGEESIFSILISVPSTAGAQVTGIDLEDTLPPGWEFITASGLPSDPTSITGNLADGYVLTWNADWTLNPGESRQVSYVARATDLANIASPNRNVASATGQSLDATLTADDDAFVEVLREEEFPQIQASKTDALFLDADNNTVPSPGDTLLYTITLINSGNATATDVVFSDTPDINTSLVTGSVTVTSSQGSYITSGNDPEDTMVAVTIGSLSHEDTVRITFMVVIGSDGFTTVSNQGLVEGSNFTDVPTDDPDTPATGDPTVTPVTTPPPVLTITKSGPAQATIGSTITYTGTLSNTSGSIAYNAVLVDQLPEGVEFVSSSHSAIYDSGSHIVTWSLGDIQPGASIPGWVTVKIKETVEDGTILTDTFSLVWKDSQENELGPATASCDTTVYTTPHLMLEKEGASDAAPGKIFSYQLILTNTGGQPATKVTLIDTLPPEVSYISSNPPGAYSAGPPESVQWELGTINPGGSLLITLTVQADDDIEVETTATNAASVEWEDEEENSYGPETAGWETTIYPDPVLEITKSGPEEAAIDSQITYTGTLSNIGGSTAYNVILQDQLPPWVVFVSSSHTAVYNSDNNVVTWNLGDLPPGSSIPGWLTVHVNQATPDNTVLLNTFVVTGENFAGDPLDPATATWNTTVHTHPLLTIEKTGPATASPGETLEYTITISNSGGCTAYNPVLTDVLPQGFFYDSENSTPPGSDSDGVIIWELENIPASGSVTIHLFVTTDEGIANTTTLINTAGVTWEDCLERTFGPVYDTADTTFYTSPLLTVSKTGQARSCPGDTLNYTIEVCNTGGTEASAVVITDILPGEVSYNAGSANYGGTYEAGSHSITWDLGSLGAGECIPDIGFEVTVASQIDNGTLLDNIVNATWQDEDEKQYGPVCDCFQTIVNTLPMINITKTGPAEAFQGDTLVYEIELSNTGGTDAYNVVLIDVLPLGLSYIDSTYSGTESGGIVSWELGTIASQSSITVELTVSVDFDLPPDTRLINTALVTWECEKGIPYGPESATAETVIGPALILDKNSISGSVFPGQMISFNIEYENQGNSPLSGVVITEHYDPNVIFQSADPPPDTGTDNVWTIGTLGRGESRTIQVIVQAKWELQGGTVLRNKVTIVSEQITEGEAEEKTELDDPPVLTATKTDSLYLDADDSGEASPGDILLYSINIINNGKAEATDVVFSDAPDINTTLISGSVTTSHGTVTGGNNGVPPVEISIGSIPDGETVVISFQVRINLPLFAAAVTNQGIITGKEVRDILTDDPDTETENDATATPIIPRYVAVGGELREPDRLALIMTCLGIASLVILPGLPVLVLRRRRSG
ncbi:MAG: DUF11 domain-containing protein [Dehalococcoidales bacterium]|nr:DUF11 domain-containing protein [Dehalococcoidales bacterium]